MFTVSGLRSAVDSGVLLGGIAETVLTVSEVLEIVYSSDQSFSNR
jgi:hypothetical protein